MKKNLILAIETSCDETSVAVVREGREVLANEIYSQIETHKKWGGVVPEVAAREHIPQIGAMVERALSKAGIGFREVDGIACTYGPGLIGSLLVGVETARYLAHIWEKPLIPVNHILGHIYANWLETESEPEFPIVCLTVSGGHNELVLLKSHAERELLGETLDDAAGEAFDKVARLLGLNYPGGPAISRAAEAGNPDGYWLPRSWLEKEWEKKKREPTNFDFSFSGLKTAVWHLVEKEKPLSDSKTKDIARAFEEAVCEVLARKVAIAALQNEAKEVHLAGGVSANARLRARVQEELEDVFGGREIPRFRFPRKIEYCTDNAAMIGAAAFWMGEEKGCEEMQAEASDFRV